MYSGQDESRFGSNPTQPQSDVQSLESAKIVQSAVAGSVNDASSSTVQLVRGPVYLAKPERLQVKHHAP